MRTGATGGGFEPPVLFREAKTLAGQNSLQWFRLSSAYLRKL
jgi:hypothetical protein